MTSTSPSSKGFALIASMLLLAMLAVFSVGISYIVQNETKLSGTDMETGQAYYAAAAAMDKMVVDFNLLHAGSDVPTVSATEALGGTSYEPSFSGVTYSDYSLTVPNTSGIPDVEVRPVSVGSLRGLLAQVTPITLTATAEAAGETVAMTRTIELSQIPVFQFGVFSDDDLSYFETPAFDFGGRVHSNGNLFLATGTTDGLVFHSRVSAAGEVIRSELANGKGTEALSLDYAVKIPTAHNGCEGSKPACRALTSTEGSKTGGPSSSDNSSWTNLSETTYNGTILSEATGAKALELALSESGGRAIELIRRPASGESLTSTLYQSRLYNKAQIRVLLNDAVTDLPGGVGVELAKVAPYWDGSLHGATDTAFDSQADGYLLVQYRNEDGDYNDVTMEWLDQGIARENPDAILKFQAIDDHEMDGTPNHPNTAAERRKDNVWDPINLYDTREGEVRDSVAYSTCALGGIINIIELDVGNLQRWLAGTIGTNGPNVETLSHNGYLFYFSDRRGMLANPSGNVVGEYGYEDIINPPVTTGAPNNTLDSGEDVNENSSLDTYGADNLGDGFGKSNGDPTKRINCIDGFRKSVSGARHALKLVNGTLGNLPTKSGAGGFTVGSENPVYVQGNYNANASGFGDPHAAAAIIADAVTFLSNGWSDRLSFVYPNSPSSRYATATWYRVAVVAGKNNTWTNPSWSLNYNDGLDGGVHEFLRKLEFWYNTFNYKGSLVSLWNSEQGVGVYKCCTSVLYNLGSSLTFDTDFLDPAKLPPSTPGFQDYATSGARQVF